MTSTPVDFVDFTIDGVPITVPKGTAVIRAAESAGIDIPRFCDHPLLDPVAACRECMVEVPDAGNGRGMKPQPACALQAMPGMVIKTAATSAVAQQAQQGMLEFLLINHPLDCPQCDKGGECPLQNQAMADGRGYSRYDGVKRTYPKPVAISHMLLLDRERCVLCQRCTRFGDQISGDLLLSLVERGAKSQIGRGDDDAVRPVGQPSVSYFAGNLAQICPVGALTTSDYRFQARPFDIVSTNTTCENCAAGCTLRVDQRHGEVRRRLAGQNLGVNQEWSCDKGRFAFRSSSDQLTSPLVRGVDGQLHEVTWPQALAAAAAGLSTLNGRVGVLPGGHLSVENASAYARFARLALGTDSVDSRTRRGANAEEAGFLARQSQRLARTAGTGSPPVTYDDLAKASQVVLVGLEPEDECPMIFLTLRKAVRKAHCQVTTLAPMASSGSVKLSAKVISVAPGDERAALESLALGPEAIVLVGERAGAVPGLLTAVESLAARLGLRLAWVPRRAGELGAIAAGCLPIWAATGQVGLAALAKAWQVDALPARPGLDAAGMLAAAGRGEIGLLLGGVDLDDLDDPVAARAALAAAPFVVSLEQRPSAAAMAADVVLPVALLTQQVGSFMDWTGAIRPVEAVVPVQPMTDWRVLAALAKRLGHDIGMDTLRDVRRIVSATVAVWAGLPTMPLPVLNKSAATPRVASSAVLATWRSLLVGSKSLDKATCLSPRPPVVTINPQMAAAIGLAAGAAAGVTGPNGATVVAPVVIDQQAASGVVTLLDAPWPSGSPVALSRANAPGEVLVNRGRRAAAGGD